MTNGVPSRTGGKIETDSGADLDRDRGLGEELSDSREISAVADVTEDDSPAVSAPESNVDHRQLSEERDALREEIAQVRRALAEVQERHGKEADSIRDQLTTTRGEKEQAEAQYRGLLGKVSTIRSQLGERLKADAVGPTSGTVLYAAYRSVGGSIPGTKSHRRSRGAVCEPT